MLRLHTPLFNAAIDAPEAGGPGDTAPKATIGQQLRAALSSKTDLTARLDLSNSSLQSVTAERDSARAELATSQARVKELEGQLAEVNAAIVEHQAEVTKLTAAEQSLEKRASAQAKTIVQSVGIEASALPGAKDTPPPSTGSKAAYEAFSKEKDSEKKPELFQAYKRALAAEQKTAA